VEKIRRVVTDYFEQGQESSLALAAAAEAQAVMADEPLGAHPATLEEVGEETPGEKSGAEAAAELPVQEGGAQPAAEQAESSEEEGLGGGKGGMR
jgi:hypothetical protein